MNKFRLILALFITTMMAGATQAADPLYGGVGFIDANHGVTIAMKLTPQADIIVTQLGVFDGGSDGPGLMTAHDVGLWDANGTLLATTVVDNNATLINGFRYVAITPVVLSATQTYTLGAYYPLNMPGDKLVATVLNPSPFVSLATTSHLEGGSVLAVPNPGVTNTDFRIGANLLFNPVDTTSRVDISGTVKSTGGLDICAMVLASGQYMFSCNPWGIHALSNLPRKQDGTVTLQVYASGFQPWKQTLVNSGTVDVVMTPAGTCPNYNPTYSPGVYPGSAGQWFNISGNVLLGSNGVTPICAMVLANGQYMFSCGGAGSYNLNVPLNTNGQINLQVYADGFAPYNIIIDEFKLVNDALLARSSECS